MSETSTTANPMRFRRRLQKNCQGRTRLRTFRRAKATEHPAGPTDCVARHFDHSVCQEFLRTVVLRVVVCHCSNAKMRFQSFFMLITVDPSFFASSYSACVKVPTLLSGRPWAGP